MRFKRNWGKWGLGYISHWATGLVAGFLLTTTIWPAGLGLVACLLTYQVVEFLKYRDTVALDVKDVTIGVGVGILIGIGVYLWMKGAFG